MTLEAAIAIAKPGFYNKPFLSETERAALPNPTPKQALAQIQTEQKLCGFNWLTGVEAIRILSQTAKNL